MNMTADMIIAQLEQNNNPMLMRERVLADEIKRQRIEIEALETEVGFATMRANEDRDEWKARAEAAEAELRKAREQEPVAWYRPKSDGGYEGPLMDSDSRICDARRGVWTPLYAIQFKPDWADYRQGYADGQDDAAPKPAAPDSNSPEFEGIEPAAPAVPAVPESTCNNGLQVPQEWREVLIGLIAIAEKKGKRQGSPNHCHAIPGIWDSDNGVLAGKPCAECAMYDSARALLQTTGAKP